MVPRRKSWAACSPSSRRRAWKPSPARTAGSGRRAMRRLAPLLAVAAALASGAALGQANDEALQRAFTEGMQQVQAGNLAQAEAISRAVLTRTRGPRVTQEA